MLFRSIDRAGTDAQASLVVFLDLSDTVSLTAHRVNVHDNIIMPGSPVNIDLRDQIGRASCRERV